MPFKQRLAVAALVCLPVAATAQHHSKHSPADAAAPVAASAYESAFKNYRASDVGSETPDKVWRRANDDMGQLGGHAGQMKDGTHRRAWSGAESHDHETREGSHH